MSDDVIRRSDAIKAFTFNSKGERIPFVDCDNFPVEFPLRYIVDTLAALPSADKPSAADLSSVYSTAYKSGYDKGYADAVQGIADELVKQGKHIEVDRPQGEWIFVEEFMGINRYKCSVCEREELLTYLKNFCSNCGARMKGADDE